ncbi:hypothetical protein M2281_005383 [Mesorhizobium soli]|nr:hypothetical protein [Mesorhizobium soli]
MLSQFIDQPTTQGIVPAEQSSIKGGRDAGL